MEDPFFDVKEEVLRAMQNAKTMQFRYNEMVDMGAPKNDVCFEELRRVLRQVEWDLEDLDETISIVESNPAKFRIDVGEINRRKQFIADTRHSVKYILDGVNSAKQRQENVNTRSNLMAKAGSKVKKNPYQKLLDDEVEDANNQFIDNEFQHQETIVAEQDKKLDQIGTVLTELKHKGQAIGDEVDRQDVIIDNLTEQVDRTDGKLRQIIKKVDHIMHASSDKKQTIAIVVLMIVLIILIVVYFAT
eukprot:Colp12_sorted_trinity150504_noHs@31102